MQDCIGSTLTTTGASELHAAALDDRLAGIRELADAAAGLELREGRHLMDEQLTFWRDGIHNREESEQQTTETVGLGLLHEKLISATSRGSLSSFANTSSAQRLRASVSAAASWGENSCGLTHFGELTGKGVAQPLEQASHDDLLSLRAPATSPWRVVLTR